MMSKKNQMLFIIATVIIVVNIFLCFFLLTLKKTPYERLVDKLNSKSTFYLLVYNDDLDKDALKEIKKDYPNIILFDIDNDFKSEFNDWLETENGKNTYSSFHSFECNSTCSSMYSSSGFHFDACTGAEVVDDDTCKKIFSEDYGFEIFLKKKLEDLGIYWKNTVYKVTNGKIVVEERY